MGFDVADCVLSGSALTEPFLRDAFLPIAQRLGAYPGPQDETLSAAAWSAYRRRLLGMGRSGGALRIHRHVIAPLAGLLGYTDSGRQPDVATREGMEDGGWLMRAADGTRLRSWAVPMDTGLDGFRAGTSGEARGGSRGRPRIRRAPIALARPAPPYGCCWPAGSVPGC